MNEDTTQQLLRELLREMRESNTRTETGNLALNALNTEVARMSVQLKHVSDQQTSLQDHDKRLAVLEAKFTNHETTMHKLSEQGRWLIGTFIVLVTVGIAIAGIFAQFVKVK